MDESTHNWLLVREIRHISEDDCTLCLNRLANLLCLLKHKCSLDAVQWLCAVGAGCEFDDRPGLHAVGAKVLVNQRHVGGKVVVHVECGIGLIWIKDGACYCHFGGCLRVNVVVGVWESSIGVLGWRLVWPLMFVKLLDM